MSEPRHVRVVLGQPDPETDRTGALVETPFDADFVADLKGTVPWRERSWSPTERTWWVHEDYAEEVTDLVVYHFGETVVVDEDGVEEYRTAAGVNARQERLL